MKKFAKILSALLIGSMLLGMAACSKETETTKKKKKKTKKTTTEATETEDPTEDPTDDPTDPTEDPTDEPTNTTDEPGDSTSGTPTTGNPGGGLLIDVPEECCAIEVPDGPRFHYVMTLELDTEANTIGGHVDVDFFNTSDDDWDKLCLRDYSSLFVDGKNIGKTSSAKLEGALTEITNIVDGRDQSTIEYTRDEDVSVVWFPLSTKLAPGESMKLSYDFVAKVPAIADRYGVYNGVYNITNFYPILAVYVNGDWSHEAYYNVGECFFSEISDYDVTLTVPEDFMVLSTGTASDEKVQNGKKVYTLQGPYVRDFVFSASNSFKLIEGDYKGVHINVVYDEAHPASSTMDECLEACLKASQDSLAALGEAFGEYPYPEVDVVLAPIDAGGMEYPNLVIITVDSFYCSQNSFEAIPYQYISEVIAHELGHQWFMGIVGSNSGLEPWLDESFASYTEIVYETYMNRTQGTDIEDYETFGRKIIDLCDPTMTAILKSYDEAPINRPHYAFSDDDTYVAAAYYIGKMALYQMEELIGQQEFHGVIREYVRRNAFTNSTEDRFFEVLYECVGQDNQDLNNLISGIFGR